MATILNRQVTFATNGTVTAAGLHNLIDETEIYAGIITTQPVITSVGSSDQLLIADSDLTATSAPRRVTVGSMFNDALSNGIYTSSSFTGTLTAGSFVGPLNGNVTGTIIGTGGTISSFTTGTTTSTATNITNGTVQTLTASTATITGGTYSGTINATSGTIATFNSTTGTIAGLNSTNGTVATLNSTTGTITNLRSTTGTVATINSTTGTIETLTSSTSTVSGILTSKNVAINVNTLATATGTQNLDFTSEGYLTHSITGNITYTASNYAAGKSLSVRITSDATQRNLTFPASWVFVGSKPTAIAASKKAILSVTSFGATEAETVAAYAVQT